MSRLQREPSKWTRLGHPGALWLPRQQWQQKDQEIRSMKLLWMVGESHTFIYVSLALIKTTLIETAQDRILVFSLKNTNKSQDVKNPPNIQGSPSLWNIDSMFYAIELDEYDWISKKIYIYILSSSSIFRYWTVIQDLGSYWLPQKDNRYQMS